MGVILNLVDFRAAVTRNDVTASRRAGYARRGSAPQPVTAADIPYFERLVLGAGAEAAGDECRFRAVLEQKITKAMAL